MSVVLDASVAVAWLHPEETTRAVVELFDGLLNDDNVWVPSLWHLEVANIFQRNARLGKYPTVTRDRYLQNLKALPIKTDGETAFVAWGETLNLAHLHNLTLYDASYLELALRRSLPLATLDKALRTAAAAEGVPLLGL
jgi:predicted nucleic acid-binding protein